MVVFFFFDCGQLVIMMFFFEVCLCSKCYSFLVMNGMYGCSNFRIVLKNVVVVLSVLVLIGCL